MQTHHEKNLNSSPSFIPKHEGVLDKDPLVPDAIKKIKQSDIVYRDAKVEGKINKPTSILASLLSLAAARTKKIN